MQKRRVTEAPPPLIDRSAVDQLAFDDNRLVAGLSGEHDAHLQIVEKAFGVRIDPRGNVLNISGPARRARRGRRRAPPSL